MRALLLVGICMIGCDPGGRATPDADEGIDTLYAPGLNIFGRVTLQDGSPVTGAPVALHHEGGALTGHEMLTDAQGNYTLTLQAGFAITGFLNVEMSGYVTSELWRGLPLIEEFAAPPIVMRTPAEVDQLYTSAQVTRDPARGLVIVRVSDGATAIDAATVASIPSAGAYRYSGSNGMPAVSASATSQDGTADWFGSPTYLSLSAAKSGMTFTRPEVTAPADTVTFAVVSRR